jgi:hypothetical protein
MRRKGERPVVKQLTRWSPDHPVARAIGDGDHWFKAWQMQECTPDQKLSRLTGISTGRFVAMELGYAVSKAEVDALGRAWGVSSADLIESMGNSTTVVD